MGDCKVEKAVRGLAGDNCNSLVPAPKQGFPGDEVETRLGLFPAVAAHTVLLQDIADAGPEQLLASGHPGCVFLVHSRGRMGQSKEEKNRQGFRHTGWSPPGRDQASPQEGRPVTDIAGVS